MNSFRAAMAESGLDLGDVARLLNLDVAAVIQFGMQVGFINLETCLGICNVLNVSFFDLFPSMHDLKPELSEEAEIEDEAPFVYALFEKTEFHPRLLACGIDPDPSQWFVAFQLSTGLERRYRLSSIEKNRLENALSFAADTSGHFVFHADCQTVIIRRSAVLDVRFANSMSYAQFSSDEKAYAATLVLPGSPFPVVTTLIPDNRLPAGHGSPLFNLISAARDGQDLPPFIRFADSDEIRFLQIENMELFEIPVGLTIPGFYDDEKEGADLPGDEANLLHAEAMGTA